MDSENNSGKTIKSDINTEPIDSDVDTSFALELVYIETISNDRIKTVYKMTNSIKRLSVTRVAFSIDYLDASGNVLRSVNLDRNYRVSPIQSGKTRVGFYIHSFQGAQIPTNVLIRTARIYTCEQLKAYKDAKENSFLFDFYNDEKMKSFADNFYNDMPLKMEYFKAEVVHSYTYDKTTITEAFEALKKVKIGGETNDSVTDDSLWFVFTMHDDSTVTLGFESQNAIIYRNKHYGVLDDGGCFSLSIFKK